MARRPTTADGRHGKAGAGPGNSANALWRQRSGRGFVVLDVVVLNVCICSSRFGGRDKKREGLFFFFFFFLSFFLSLSLSLSPFLVSL